MDEPKFQCYLPAFIGPRGWVALRLDAGAIDWAEGPSLMKTAAGSSRPQRLAALIEGPPT
jgi:hypothetical protein